MTTGLIEATPNTQAQTQFGQEVSGANDLQSYIYRLVILRPGHPHKETIFIPVFATDEQAAIKEITEFAKTANFSIKGQPALQHEQKIESGVVNFWLPKK